MKLFKTTLIMAAVALSAPMAMAQFSVVKGQARVGKLGENPNSFVVPDFPAIGVNSLSIPSIGMQEYVMLDTTSNLCILGKYRNNAGGLLTFGDMKKVYIGEHGITDTDILSLGGYRGLRYVGKNVIFFHTGAPGMPFSFNTPVSTISLQVPTDKRLQKDMTVLNGCADLLYKLNPVSYKLSKLPLEADENERNEEVPGILFASQRYGFNITEINKTFPSLISQDAYGNNTVDYAAMIPILVSALNELNERIQEQEETIAALTVSEAPSHTQARRRNAGIEESTVSTATLAQNRPNPFNATTTIECSVPESINTAYLYIYDMQGKQIKRFNIEQRGASTVTIDGSTLQPGMYIYALIADGKEIDSKRMILTD